jgi:folate-binding protein YgfZ
VTPQQEALAVRRAAGLFSLDGRGLLSVRGGDRVRWLDGMLSNDVAGLAPGPERSGCYALLLTRQGRIVADFHVLERGAELWLETARDAVPRALETLARFIVADDVALADASARVERLALEGPAAPAILERALGAPLALAPECCAEVELAGAPLVVAAFGFGGLPARQLFAAPGQGARVAEALRAAGAQSGLVPAGAAALEILRIEAGVPGFGTELGPEVLPAEARLERAVSTTKGCYTGQEVVARMRSRARVGHLLVGLRCAGSEPPAAGAELRAGDQKVGEVTSACLSPVAGAIALGFVRAAHAQAGTRLAAAGCAGEALVAELPFVPAAGA